MHAKTAENLSGIINYTETDPLFSAWDKTTGVTYIETQNLSDVIAKNNSANAQIKNVSDPTDPQDAATKAYVDVLNEKILELQVEIGVTDHSGRHYKAVKIGNQIWMAENLAYLPAVYPPSDHSYNKPRYYVYEYNSNIVSEAKATSNFAVYGVLYNWVAAINGGEYSNTNPSGVQGVCPHSWHLPSDAEWSELTDYLGGESISGGKLKEAGSDHWLIPNTDASNSSGFAALPGGRHDRFGKFYSIGEIGIWWSTSTDDARSPWLRILNFNSGDVHRGYEDPDGGGFSVRCVKD